MVHFNPNHTSVVREGGGGHLMPCLYSAIQLDKKKQKKNMILGIYVSLFNDGLYRKIEIQKSIRDRAKKQ